MEPYGFELHKTGAGMQRRPCYGVLVTTSIYANCAMIDCTCA